MEAARNIGDSKDEELRDLIIRVYREGRQASIRIGQLLENKRQSLGGTSRGGRPIKSRFWTWFEEQDFPFSRNTAENYLLFAREPERYVLHCEQVRKRSQSQREALKDPDQDTVNVGLDRELYHRVQQLAWKQRKTVNEIIDQAVIDYLDRWSE
jgi:hypothetical protein